jgi:hypothetical protein
MRLSLAGAHMQQISPGFPLGCSCGGVRGIAREVAPSAGFRFVCYCRDCQAFAHFLGRSDVLDNGGGTDIFQMPPKRVEITAGLHAVRCPRLSDRGVYRWYAECCRTPIGNTFGPRVPMIGMIHNFMDHLADGRSRDDILGPPLCRIFERSAVGPLPPAAPPPPSFGLHLRRMSKMLVWSMGGLARPHPFFDAQTGAPNSTPRALTTQERIALEKAVSATCRP